MNHASWKAWSGSSRDIAMDSTALVRYALCRVDLLGFFISLATRNEMAKLVYFDTSVWMAPYDELSEPRKAQVPAIEQLVNKHKSNEIVLHTSRQVMNELLDLLRNPEKAEKASKALQMLESLHLTQLPFVVAVYNHPFTVFGEARYDQRPKFDETSLKGKDKLIAEFMTANNLDYFVSVDEDFLKRKAEIEALLARENTSVLEPQDLLKLLA